jgi:hypothetical protein
MPVAQAAGAPAARKVNTLKIVVVTTSLPAVNATAAASMLQVKDVDLARM